ncbi:MAG: hypothetical protein ACLFVW_00045 [Phycisphaerae bacterium]
MSRISIALAVWSLITPLGCAETPEAGARQPSADGRTLQDAEETADSGKQDDLTWRIYDTMHDRPGSQASLGRHGIVPAHVFMKNSFYEPGEDKGEPPTEKRVKKFARKIPHEVLTCMDLEGEDWTRLTYWDSDAGDWAFNEDAYETMLNIARWINEANSDLTWGFFWRPPVSGLWKSAHKNHLEGNTERAEEIMSRWREYEERIEPLYHEVDVVIVSLYYTDRRYRTFAEFQQAAAFFFEHWENPTDKPVYVFMCPLDPYTNTSRGGKFLSRQHWRWCMDFAYEHTDGLLLWSDVPFDWDTHAKGRPWWGETQRFLREINRTERLREDDSAAR